MTISNSIKWRKAVQLSAIFFFSTLVINSCKKKEDSNLGLEIQPQGDQLSVVVEDTIQLTTYSVPSDSVQTNAVTSNTMLGSYVDPYFGKISASIYTQIRLDGAVDFTPDGGVLTDIVMDSVILYLRLNNLYGNFDAQNFEVYQITEDLDIDSKYYSTTTKTTSSLNLVAAGGGTIVPDLVNNGTVNGSQTDAPILRIPLSITDFAQPIIDQSGTGVLDGNDGTGAFMDWFKGLKIMVNNTNQGVNEGGILYIDLEDNDTKITMYFRDIVNAEALQFDLNINSKSAHFSNLNIDITNSAVEALYADSTQGENLFFLQTMGGPKAKVSFENIQDYIDSGNVVINKAELVLPTQYYVSDKYLPASELFILRTNASGKEVFLPDFSTSGGSLYDYSTASYRFDITRYVAGLFKGDYELTPMTIISNGNAVTANRVVFNGSNTQLKDKPKLVLTFTRY